ncbi:hypothetical protein RVM27_16055 [Halomonas sp. KM007]
MNGDNGYIAMQVSGLEVLPGAGLTDSGDGSYLGRSTSVKNMIPNLSALKINKSGEPAHPLYLKSSLVPVKLSI